MKDMLKVLEFRSRIKALKDEGNEILNRCEQENRDRNEDEQRQWVQINSEMDRVEKRMDEYIKLNKISEEELRDHIAQRTDTASPQAKKPGPFRNLGEQLLAVADYAMGRSTDNRLLEVRAVSGLNETIPSEGGFLVQQDFYAELLKPVYETNEIPGRCLRIPISGPSNSFSMNTVDETSRATGSRWGGLRVYRRAEAETITASKPKFGKIEMKLEDLMGLCYATRENLQDAAQLAGIIQQGFRDEFGFVLSDEIYRGDGAGKCLGILNSGALVEVPKETGQTNYTVITENILKMWKSRQGRNLVWFYNQELEDQLELMTYAIGTGGEMARLFKAPEGNAPYGTIKGRPAIPVEVASAPGDVGDILLADMSQYLLIDKGGIEEAESIHVKFLENEMTYRFIYRCNGQPMAKSKLTPYKRRSSDFYLSPFVAIASRA
jgi:HK97 family phage major capsid protein